MGVTAVKRLKNSSSSVVRLINRENPNTKGNDIAVSPGEELEVDMWVPWATSANEFETHRLELYRDGATYSIWQANRDDGDFVRFSSDGAWADPGAHVHGFADVDGDRAIVVLDDRVEFAARAVHGVTALVRVDNESSADVAVFDIEDSSVPGNGLIVAPGSTESVEMWIPWAARATDFPRHHLRVEVGGTPRYWIWQAERSDGDFVRYSNDGAWHDPGERVPGLADVTRERAVVVTDSSFEFVRARRRPGPPPTFEQTGVDEVTMTRTDHDSFLFSGRASNPGRPARVRTVKNITRTDDGQSGVRLSVSHKDTTGAATGPIELAPGAAIDTFAQLLVDGEWDAEALGVYNFQLGSHAAVEVAWALDDEAREHKVTCVIPDDSDADRRISGIGGELEDAVPWFLDIDDAIEWITDGAKFYVDGLGGARIYLEVATAASGTRYLKTTTDSTTPNNLLELPSCYY